MTRLVFNLGLFLLGYFFGFYLGEDWAGKKTQPQPQPDPRLALHKDAPKAWNPSRVDEGPWFISVDLEYLERLLRYGHPHAR